MLRDGNIDKVCPAAKLTLGSKFSRMVTYYVASLLISVGERRVEMLNLDDISRTVVTCIAQ